MKRSEAKTTTAAAAASNNLRSRGTRGRGRAGRGKALLTRSGKIGVETARQSLLDNFGFADTEQTQPYTFNDSDDDFLTDGNPKHQWKKSSHKGRSCASTAVQKTRNISPIEIDVDENSHEADNLMGEAATLTGGGGEEDQRSRSITPGQKSRSVTPDSQESKKSSTDVSRPVSSTSLISNRSSRATTRSNTPLPCVDLGGGNTMLDEETTNDTVSNEAEHHHRTRGAKAKHLDEEFEKNTRRIGELLEQEEDLDRASVSSENSDFFSSVVKKNDPKKNVSKEPKKLGLTEEPKSQPMETIGGSYSGPSSEQDVFASDSPEENNEHEKQNVTPTTTGRKLRNQAHAPDSISVLSDVDDEQLPLSMRLERRRVNEAKERSMMEANHPRNLEEKVVETLIDKPKELLSQEKKKALKVHLSEESDEEEKENSEAEKVLKDEGVSDKDPEDSQRSKIIPKVSVKKVQRPTTENSNAYVDKKAIDTVRTTRLGRRRKNEVEMEKTEEENKTEDKVIRDHFLVIIES